MASFLICSVPDCGKPTRTAGLCRAHYKKYLKYGDENVGGTRTRPYGDNQRWLRDHAPHDGDGCLIWPFGRMKNGYGVLTVKGQTIGAHRFMCFLVNGPPPEGRVTAAHSCGNGHEGCVHPRHVRWATYSQNHADSVAHGTQGPGMMNGSAKLTDDDVRAIRAARGSVTGRALAAKYGITAAQVCNIQLRKQWAHVTD